MRVLLSDIPKRMVLDVTGSVLGRVKAPLVDTETWAVDMLRLRVTHRVANELGLAWSFWNRATIDVPTGLIYAASDAIILRVSLAELREATPHMQGETAETS